MLPDDASRWSAYGLHLAETRSHLRTCIFAGSSDIREVFGAASVNRVENFLGTVGPLSTLNLLQPEAVNLATDAERRYPGLPSVAALGCVHPAKRLYSICIHAEGCDTIDRRCGRRCSSVSDACGADLFVRARSRPTEGPAAVRGALAPGWANA